MPRANLSISIWSTTNNNDNNNNHMSPSFFTRESSRCESWSHLGQQPQPQNQSPKVQKVTSTNTKTNTNANTIDTNKSNGVTIPLPRRPLAQSSNNTYKKRSASNFLQEHYNAQTQHRELEIGGNQKRQRVDQDYYDQDTDFDFDNNNEGQQHQGTNFDLRRKIGMMTRMVQVLQHESEVLRELEQRKALLATRILGANHEQQAQYGIAGDDCFLQQIQLCRTAAEEQRTRLQEFRISRSELFMHEDTEVTY